MTKQIQTDIRGIIRDMLFMEAAVWGSWGFPALLIFMEAQERKAETKGMRNRPRAGSHTAASLQSVCRKKFHRGWSPRFRPRKLKSMSSRLGSSFPARSAWTEAQLEWASSASSISKYALAFSGIT